MCTNSIEKYNSLGVLVLENDRFIVDFRPANLAVFYVMVVLHDSPAHAYRIRNQVSGLSSGAVHIGGSGMTKILNKMLGQGYIDKQKYGKPVRYSLNEPGRIRLNQEIKHYERALSMARISLHKKSLLKMML